MAGPEFQFNPIEGFENTISFPDPSSEAEGREQIQSLLNQLRDALNLCATIAEVQGIVLGDIVDGSITDPKLSDASGQVKSVVTALNSGVPMNLVGGNTVPTTANLNDYTTPGNYHYLGSSAEAGNILNIPQAEVFILFVFKRASNIIHQIWIGSNTGTMYFRKQLSGTWDTKWTKILSEKDIVTGTYTGDGTASRTIALGFRPKAVFVSPSYGISHVNSYTYDGGLALDGYPVQRSSDTGLKDIINIGATGFTTGYYHYTDGSSYYIGNNASGTLYHYLAFK